MKILVIEDDKTIADYIAKGLREVGYGVDVASDGAEGSDLASSGAPYSAAVVDIMLPEVDGLTIIEEMRGANISTPVLILSAKRTVDDRVKGLRAGGDDYMVKPFAFSELEARIKALIRRSSSGDIISADGDSRNGALRVADLELDPWKHEARRGGEVITLQPREFRLLEFMARNAGRVVSKTAILEYVYEYNFDPQTNVIDVLIHRLRSKVDKDFEPKLIHTIRGAGYVLRAK